MKSKLLLKRTLPIIIALFVIVVVALVSTVVTLDKRVPGFSKGVGEEAYLTYTSNGVEIKMTKQDVYDMLRDENYGASSTVSQLVRLIDADLLANGEKNYLTLATDASVKERVEYAILGYTLEDYVKNNKESFELASKKAGKTYEAYLTEKVNDQIKNFKNSFLTNNGVELGENDVTFNGTTLNVATTSKAYEYYKLEEAKFLYAKDVITNNQKDNLVDYLAYQAKLESYNKYQAALKRFEDDLATWKVTDKKIRGEKPVKSDYVKAFEEVKDEPKEVTTAVTEADVSSKYGKEVVEKYWMVLINYSSSNVAKDALSQNGVEIKNGKWLNSTTQAELTDSEVVDKVIALYNQYYQNMDKAALTTAAFTPDWTNTESEFYFTRSQLSSFGIYAKNSTNGAYNYQDGSYVYNDELSSKIYLIVAKDSALSWDEYKEAQGKAWNETAFYNEYLNEILEEKVTQSYINNAMAELRYENDLLIYDVNLESKYMSAYTSDYKATKKSSKTLVCSYKVNGEKKEISVDDLFESLSGTQYGVSSFIYKYQYNWMFLEAKDNDGNLFNTYVDYKAYMDGASAKKASKDQNMYNDAIKYVNNVKDNFKANAYAKEDGTGYNSNYGWKNFIRDYYYENYNVELNSQDDLVVFYIYQQLMDKYQDYVSSVTLEKYNNVYLMYMVKTASEYMNVTADQLQIKLFDAKGNKVDPANWTAEQLTKAQGLYDEILAALPKVEKENLTAFFSGLETAFDNAPKAINGAYTGEYAYTYKYAVANSTAAPIVINVSEYKSFGFDVVSTTTTITNSTANNELNYAGRQIWKSKLNELVKGSAINETIVYSTSTDASYVPQDYYGLGNGNYLATSDGLVVLVASSLSYSTFFKTVGSTTGSSAIKTRILAEMKAYEELHKNDVGFETFEQLYAKWIKADAATKETVENQIAAVFETGLGMADVTSFGMIEDYFKAYVNDRTAFIAFPSLTYIQMYLYDKTMSDNDDYTSLSDLYDDYEDAVKDNENVEKAKDAIMNVVNKYINNASLNINFANFESFEPFLTNYADSDYSGYYLSQITTWFSNISSTSKTLVYGDYSSTAYANNEMFKSLLANLNANFSANDVTKAVMEALINDQIKANEKELTYLTFCNGSKESVESLIKAVINMKDFDSASENVLDVLFTYGDTYKAEKETYTQAMNAFKAYAKAQYQALSAADKTAELVALATQAGLVD